MVLGATDEKGWELESVEVKGRRLTGRLRRGRFQPWEFGRVTVWQMKHLFGYGTTGNPSPGYDPQEACYESCRKQGMTEFQAYCRWVDEVKPALEGVTSCQPATS